MNRPFTTLSGEAGLIDRLKGWLGGLSRCRTVELRETYRLKREMVRVPFEGFPIELVLGNKGKRLQLCPELSLVEAPESPGSADYLILDPDGYFSTISGFLRLGPSGKVILGRDDPEQQAIFAYPEGVSGRHLQLSHDGGAILLKDLSDSGTCIGPALNERKVNRLGKLRRVRAIYGGAIEPYPAKEATELLDAVTEILMREPTRPRDSRGVAGGLLDLPEQLTPVVIGDLHGQVDNLITLLSHNGFLEGLEQGTACLVFLGDLVHSELDGQMEDMDGSILLMDLVLRLKLKFPDRVFLLRGNHESFSEEVAKEGIPQGLLWARALKKARGKGYRKAMDRFYDHLPYIAVSKDVIVTHAAAPRSKVTRDMLVNIHSYPGLITELINNRMYRPNRPAGYTKGDIKRLRKSLKCEADTPFLVGHTPINRVETYWLNAGGIENHHVIFSALVDWVGVCARIGGRMIALKYPVEPLLSLVNGLQDESEAHVATQQGDAAADSSADGLTSRKRDDA